MRNKSIKYVYPLNENKIFVAVSKNIETYRINENYTIKIFDDIYNCTIIGLTQHGLYLKLVNKGE